MLDFPGMIVSAALMVVVVNALVTYMEIGRVAKLTLAGIAGLWVGLAGAASASGWLTIAKPFPVIGIFVATPLVAAAIATAWPAARAALLGLPTRLMIGLNVGRLFAVLFLLLAMQGRLAGPFPFFAGWGDIITGAFAVPLLLASVDAKHTGAITTWNLFGTADLVLAIFLGVTSAEGSPLQLFHSWPGSEAMQHLPWSFVPTVLVPFYRSCMPRSGRNCAREELANAVHPAPPIGSPEGDSSRRVAPSGGDRHSLLMPSSPGGPMPQIPAPSAPIEAPSAWLRAGVRPGDWRVELDAACLDEIRRTVDELRAYPLPTIVLGKGDFAMPACCAAMTRVCGILASGVRFAIVDRLPLSEMAAGEAMAVYWLLSSMVARPVAQKLDGTLIYDVLDTGQHALPGSGVRPDKTNIEIRFHNDNAYNDTPPDYVGLLCLHKAMSGGHSRVISFHTAHNALLARFPERLARLYEPFWFDRQREFRAGESPIFAAPVFDYGAELKARFSVHQINSGYALKGEPVDEIGEAALAAMLDIFEDEALSVDFDLEPGQIQFVDNRALGHSRTAFIDSPEPAQKRHLVRLWLRDHGRRAYPG